MTSKSDIQRFGSSGVHTVEGNVAGSRAARLTKEREKQQLLYEQQKQKIVEENSGRGSLIDKNFSSYSDKYDAEFKRQTVGLVTAEQFKRTKEALKNREFMTNLQLEEEEKKKKQRLASKKHKKRKKRKTGPLSFTMEDEEVEDLQQQSNQSAEDSNKKSLKNPHVDTDFLPDAQRDLEEANERRRLEKEWDKKQEDIKNEKVAVTYSYWDGSGHRRDIALLKKTTIGTFLELVRKQLSKEFPEIRSTSIDNLMYVKEDLIIPHNYSFYDLIATKARGKSGPLFHFDVHDDVRLVNDATIEKDESHPGKVVQRYWYEKNKHIFPASRWETYDPSVQREGYTIHGGQINSKK